MAAPAPEPAPEAVATTPAPAIEPAPAPEPPPSQATEGADLVAEEPPAEPEPAPAPTPAPTAEPVRRTYENPVFASDAPDPTVLRGDDGMYYAYTTETAFLPFQILRSPDLVSWERLGGAFEGSGPSWIKEHRWAPDVQKTGDHYTMTYAGRGHDGNMRIGYATSSTPAGPFTDRGILVEGPSGGYFIDPNLRETPDGWKLYYGSTGGTNPADQTGISEVGIDIGADGSLHTSGAPSVVLPEAGDRELVEGAWLKEHDGQFYLFYSDGRFDGSGADDYQLKVARSSSPNGPFEKLGSPVVQAGNGFTGPGHGSIITDDAGQDWLVYHAWGADRSKGRVLMLDPIDWSDGWPHVRSGSPSSGPMDAPIVDARRGATQ